MIEKKTVVVFIIIILFGIQCGLLSSAVLRTGYISSFGSTFNSNPLEISHAPEFQENKHWRHLLAVGGNLAFLPSAYNQMEKAWGKPDGKFHIKRDWSGDKLALNDEISHMLVSYKLTQFLHCGYKYAGYSDKTSLVLSIIESAFIVTAVEYPIDSYNPDQGFGVSDLLFDYTGIGLAWLKITDKRFRNWDMKTSVKSFSQTDRQVLGEETDDYDNYIYWLTYRYEPAVFGLGYSTDHPEPGNVDGEFYLGIGTTIPDLLRPLSNKLADLLCWSDFYYFNLRWKFLKLD